MSAAALTRWHGTLALIVLLVALAVIAGLQIESTAPARLQALESRPVAVMSTTCRLVAVPPAHLGSTQGRGAAARENARAKAR